MTLARAGSHRNAAIVLVSVLVATVLLIGAQAVYAAPAPFCERKPTHQRCLTPTPTAAPTATPTPTPPTQGPWTLAFEDQFAVDIPLGSFNATRTNLGPGTWWSYPYPWHNSGGDGSGTYDTSRTVSVSGGSLRVHLHHDDGEFLIASLAPVLASGSSNQLYGRYEFRMRADPLVGYKVAYLLWPQSEVWPRDGEIDFPDNRLDGVIRGFVHHQGATSGSDQTVGTTTERFPDWHTYVIEWMPGRVNFILDGVTILSTTERIPNTPMRLMLQHETLSSAIPPISSDGYVEIDYVKVWSYTP